jgi:hypothetical protein
MFFLVDTTPQPPYLASPKRLREGEEGGLILHDLGSSIITLYFTPFRWWRSRGLPRNFKLPARTELYVRAGKLPNRTELYVRAGKLPYTLYYIERFPTRFKKMELKIMLTIVNMN